MLLLMVNAFINSIVMLVTKGSRGWYCVTIKFDALQLFCIHFAMCKTSVVAAVHTAQDTSTHSVRYITTA